MASDLISRTAFLERLEKIYGNDSIGDIIMLRFLKEVICKQPTVDAVEVVYGEWNRIDGDMHSSGYAVYCSVCHKPHFVHHKFSLGALNYDELFKEPDYCSNCGADMRVGRWKGEGMGDYSCSLCGEVVSGNHRKECPNCHVKMDGGEK